MTDWLVALNEVLAAEPQAMIVTVAVTRGSAPREAGTRMIIGASAVRGTIGGGHLEFDATRIAREALDADSAVGNWLVRFPLAARLGQCCGGVATLLFQRVSASAEWPAQLLRQRSENRPLALVVGIGTPSSAPIIAAPQMIDGEGTLPASVHDAVRTLLAAAEPNAVLVPDGATTWYAERIVANDFHVVVFGNGHVGRALVQVLSTLPCTVAWIDQREHDFPLAVPANTTVVATDAPEDEVADAPPGSLFLVMTHNHALDFDLTSCILARGDFAYLGLIGSTSKRAQFEKRLAARGTPADALKRITCPIGIGAIRSKEPGAIAIAVAAQVLQLRECVANSEAGHRAQA